MGAPTRSIPDTLKKRDNMGGGQRGGHGSESSRETIHWKEQSGQRDHRIENGRADRLGKSRRWHQAGDDEAERENAEGAEQHRAGEAHDVDLHHSWEES